MSAIKIEIDFAAANAQANRLEDLAVKIQDLAEKQLSDTITLLSSGWSGESASAYLQKAEYVKDNITQTAKTLLSIAETIRTDAQRIYDAEKAAVEIAMTRK